ncbi:MAG: bifunctional response regulator/alkaline phosphatase family protein [Bacteroidota bacterium]
MSVKNINILWTDDEIDLLRPHILFLEEKGYSVVTANNGDDAIKLVKENNFDIIFLDENMPGISGLEVLEQIKRLYPAIPVIMVTKSEEEDIMDLAIGSKISDYLIKPVNPKQVLLSIKKNVDQKRLVTEKTTSDYQGAFSELGQQINLSHTFNDWKEIYKRLVYWELELDRSEDQMMDQVFLFQKNDANTAFSKYIKKHYLDFFSGQNDAERPLMSPNVFRKKVFPYLDNNEKVFVILVDNLRFDQWKVIQPVIRENYHLEDEDIFCSILPTSTQYARNAMFSGLMPSEMEKLFPDLWLNDEEEGGKNLHEEQLLKAHLARLGKNTSFFYSKVNDLRSGQKLVESYKNILGYSFSVIVYNFVDFISHSRTESKMMRELASDESAYRSITLSWFNHSPLKELLAILARHKIKVILTTDHGSIRVKNPVKVIGDRNTTTNLRYKQGRNLNYNPKEVIEISEPSRAFLPKTNVSSSYIFSYPDDFFAYPNNFNHYVNYYKDTFQHGGVSMEEMLVPVITLSPKL